MSRRTPIKYPPPSGDAETDLWMRVITEILSALPQIITFHTATGPNDAAIAAGPGTLGIELNLAATNRLWIKASEETSTTGWVAFATVP